MPGAAGIAIWSPASNETLALAIDPLPGPPHVGSDGHEAAPSRSRVGSP